MSFDTEVVKPARGRALIVDASADGFSTMTYRWGDKAGLFEGSTGRDNRLLELGNIKRGLGENRIAASSTTSITLDNADGALDALCGQEGLELAASLKFRVYVVFYDPTVRPLVFNEKQLGEFVLRGWPVQTNTTVTLNLADDMMGMLGPGLELPNFRDWSEVGDASDNPVFDTAGGMGLPDSISEYAPIQLAFGEDWLLTHPHVIPVDHNAGGDVYRDKIIVPLYCTTDLSAVSQDLIQQVRVERYSRPATLEAQDGVPELYEVPRTTGDPLTLEVLTVWRVEKSPTITKAGKDFQIVYLVVRTDLGDRSLYYAVQDPQRPELFAQRVAQLARYAYASGYPVSVVDSDFAGATGPGGGGGGSYATITSRVQKWHVKGVPLSQITNPPTLPGSHAIDVMVDLVSEYSDATVDATSATRVKAGSPNARCFGVVQAWSERANNAMLYQPPLSLRQVLTQLAQSSDFDIFINWDGEVAFASDVYDFTTATQAASLIEIPETELKDMRRWVASNGERHSAYNRVFLEGGRSNPAEGRGFGMGGYGDNGLPFQGPWDIEGATIPVTTRIIEVGLQQGWRPWAQQREDPLQWRSLDVTSRSKCSFVMGKDGLRLELGDYFKVNWTRGASIGGPYTSTIFQAEGITYAPGDDTVLIEAVWRNDTVTERQYLLDDETLLVRQKSALSGTATPDGFGSVEFGGDIDLDAMGVETGDILVLRDSAQATDVFTRNGAWRIGAAATDVCDIENNGEGNQPAAGVVANADWYIVAGATTYPTAVSHPIDYPSGGAMYGKVTNPDGETSDSATGNRLISG